MTKLAVAASLAVAVGLGAIFSASTEYHRYTVTFVKDSNGVIRAEKDPGVFYFEIDYGYGTDWTFVNNTGVAIDVEFLEPPSRSMCHLQFSPAGSVFCESQVMKLAATLGATSSLHADALDLWPNDYCWSTDRCPGEVRVGLHDQVRIPIDPDLQIERDYLFAAVAGTIAVVLTLGVAFLRFRRRGRLSGRQGSPAAS